MRYGTGADVGSGANLLLAVCLCSLGVDCVDNVGLKVAPWRPFNEEGLRPRI